MNESILYKIDKATLETIAKGGGYQTEANIKNSFKKMVFNQDLNGFTSNNGGRAGLREVNPKEIEREMLKNIVKVKRLEEHNGYVTMLNINKDYGDDLTLQEAEALLEKMIIELHVAGIEYLLNKFPNLRAKLVESFVNKRYYNRLYGFEAIDSLEIIDEKTNYYLNKIDSYYDELLGANISR